MADDLPPGSLNRHTAAGPGRVIIALYAMLALAATGRSAVQIVQYFHRAPLAYVLSAVAAGFYLVATATLIRGTRAATRIAVLSCGIELVGVVAVGVMSYVIPALFPDKTVWSHFGSGYGYLPVILPVVGLWWLNRSGALAARHPVRARTPE